MAATAPLLPPATTPVVVTWTGSVVPTCVSGMQFSTIPCLDGVLQSIPDRSTAAATIPLQTNANIKVEHVQVRFVASHPRRGGKTTTVTTA